MNFVADAGNGTFINESYYRKYKIPLKLSQASFYKKIVNSVA
jgi:hypothetical protein